MYERYNRAQLYQHIQHVIIYTVALYTTPTSTSSHIISHHITSSHEIIISHSSTIYKEVSCTVTYCNSVSWSLFSGPFVMLLGCTRLTYLLLSLSHCVMRLMREKHLNLASMIHNRAAKTRDQASHCYILLHSFTVYLHHVCWCTNTRAEHPGMYGICGSQLYRPLLLDWNTLIIQPPHSPPFYTLNTLCILCILCRMSSMYRCLDRFDSTKLD